MTASSTLKVLVLGSSGLLGCTLLPNLIVRDYDVRTHSRCSETEYRTDLNNLTATYALLERTEPEVVVNLVGLTDVDCCEIQPNLAYLANVQTVENVVTCIKRRGRPCHFVHISTDQVYDGVNPHTEKDVTLSNYYGFSKYAGELTAMRVPATILRTNFFGRSQCAKRASLTDWLFHSLSNGTPIQVFDDVLFNPLSMVTLAEMIELCIRKKAVGIFNLGSHGGMSKADLAFAFAEELNLSTSTMMRASSNQAHFLRAYRPKDMRMDLLRFEEAFNVKLPLLKTEIGLVAREYS